jgi:hypothetical protein
VLVGDDDAMDLVIAHDPRGGAHVFVPGNRVDLLGHDRAHRGAAVELGHEVRGGDDPDRLSLAVDYRDGADLVAFDELPDVVDALVGLSRDDGFRHEIVDLDVHGRSNEAVEDWASQCNAASRRFSVALCHSGGSLTSRYTGQTWRDRHASPSS